MTDELSRRLTDRVDAATPDIVPPYAEVLARHTRHRRRRVAVGTAAILVVVGAAATLGAVAANQPSEGRGDGALATEPPSTSAPAEALQVPERGSGGDPPPIVVAGAGPQATAWQGSYCWGNRCVDMAAPGWHDLPDVDTVPTVLAGFTDPGATWAVSLVGRTGCARYPVLLTPVGVGTYELTPSGPAGQYRADVFIRSAAGGDTTGAFRWTTSGATAPTSWAHLHQNGRFESGGGVVQVVLDRAAVDGQVRGDITVTGVDGSSHRFPLEVADAGCSGDGYALLAPQGLVDPAVDGLGAGPFTYDVDVVVEGTHHRASAASGNDAEDTPLTFSPPLPSGG